MQLEDIRIVTMILPFVIAILALVFLLLLARNVKPKEAMQDAYSRARKRLSEKKSLFFDYMDVDRFLTSNGAQFHYGAWVDPIKFMGMRICFAALLFAAGMMISFPLSFLTAWIGFFLPKWMLSRMNESDNIKMMPQVQTMYASLQAQIAAGVNLTDALAESYRHFAPGRLQAALIDFSSALYMRGSFDDALQEFNDKFNNTLIDSLCIILHQAQESGKAVDVLKDMSKQIDSVRSAANIKKKEHLDRVTTFCLLGIVAAIIGLVLYAAILQMGELSNAL